MRINSAWLLTLGGGDLSGALCSQGHFKTNFKLLILTKRCSGFQFAVYMN